VESRGDESPNHGSPHQVIVRKILRFVFQVVKMDETQISQCQNVMIFWYYQILSKYHENIKISTSDEYSPFLGSHPSLINVETSLTYLLVTKQAAANCSLCSLVERNFAIGWKTISDHNIMRISKYQIAWYFDIIRILMRKSKYQILNQMHYQKSESYESYWVTNTARQSNRT